MLRKRSAQSRDVLCDAMLCCALPYCSMLCYARLLGTLHLTSIGVVLPTVTCLGLLPSACKPLFVRIPILQETDPHFAGVSLHTGYVSLGKVDLLVDCTYGISKRNILTVHAGVKRLFFFWLIASGHHSPLVQS